RSRRSDDSSGLEVAAAKAVCASTVVLLGVPGWRPPRLSLGPLYRAPPAIVPGRGFLWTGCYIGGTIGWGRGRDTVSIPNLGETTGVPELAGVSLPSVTGDTKGVVGGGQVGCNYQFAPNWVIGIEGDGEAANIKGDVTDSVSFINPLTRLPE